MTTLLLRKALVLISILSVSVSESCRKDSDCQELSFRHYCCRRQCITKEEEEEKCLKTSSIRTGYIIMCATVGGVSLFAVIVCFACPRCPCYKCRRAGVSTASTVPHSPAYHTSAALTTVTLSAPGQMYPDTGVPQGYGLEQSHPHLPPYTATDSSSKGYSKDQEGIQREASPPPYSAWDEGSIPQTLTGKSEDWT